MDKMDNNDFTFEDISSDSNESVLEKSKRIAKQTAEIAKLTADSYGNKAFKNIDRVIKLISFVVAIATFLIFLVGAVVLYLVDKALIFPCALILLLGAAVSLCSLFLIYGLGHLITQNRQLLAQNKAILEMLDK